MKLIMKLVCLTAVGMVACSPERSDPGSSVSEPRQSQKYLKSENALPNRYIVVLRDVPANDDVQSRAAELTNTFSINSFATITAYYEHALKGFVAEMDPADALALSEDPDVEFVEEDQPVYAIATQNNPPWGLDRIDQRNLPLNRTYNYSVTGAGVNAYIIDTGIRTSHVDFGGRATGDFTAINDGRGASDCNGHGTHVSGTTGGATYGVAKAARLHAVRVLDCNGSGTTSGVISGVDWVTGHAARPAVANMSLGGGASSALDSAVSRSISAGISYSIAAGNSNANACGFSPARVSTAVTVGATTMTDARSSFSNFGTCVTIFAPGSGILSSWNTSDTATATLSGTSMATPHVTGAIALYLQQNPSATPATVKQTIISRATLNHVGNPGSGSPNRLLFTAP